MLVTGPFKNVSHVVHANQLICTDNYLRFVKSNESLAYLKRDFLYVPGTWRGTKQVAASLRANVFADKTVVVGHSDLGTSKFDSRFIKHWLGASRVLGTNLVPVSDLASALPLGVTNHTDESPLHGLFGNPDHFLLADSRSVFVEKFSPLYYVNFTAGNNKSERGKLLRLLSTGLAASSVIYDEPLFTAEGRVAFLGKCRTVPFVLCPEGNGVDTHRLWEVLYMGGVPVVKSNPALNEIFERLPIVVLSNWRQLCDSAFMEQEWMKVSSRIWDSALLTQLFWNKHIQQFAKSGS